MHFLALHVLCMDTGINIHFLQHQEHLRISHHYSTHALGGLLSAHTCTTTHERTIKLKPRPLLFRRLLAGRPTAFPHFYLTCTLNLPTPASKPPSHENSGIMAYSSFVLPATGFFVAHCLPAQSGSCCIVPYLMLHIAPHTCHLTVPVGFAYAARQKTPHTAPPAPFPPPRARYCTLRTRYLLTCGGARTSLPAAYRHATCLPPRIY